MAVVNRNMFDASVHADPTGKGTSVVVALPLNVVAHIVSYVSRAPGSGSGSYGSFSIAD